MKKNENIIWTLCIIIVILAIIISTTVIYLKNNKKIEPVESFMHYPYKEITLVLSPDWVVSENKPEAIMFQRDASKLKIPSIIDNLTIYTYKTLPIKDLHIMVNSYALYIKTTGYKIISIGDSNKEINLGNSYWIKYSKNNIISETFFIKKNGIIYSVTSSYSEASHIKNDMSQDLYEIVRKIY